MKRIINLFFTSVIILGLGYIGIDAFFSNGISHARIDSLANGSLVRSTQLSDTQLIAHEIHEGSAENKNLACLGETPALRDKKLARLQNIISVGGYLNASDQKCIDKVYEGRASFLKIVKKRVSSVFAEDPGPQLCGKVVFNPRLGRQRVSLPSGCEIPYTIEVAGGYYQLFAKNSKQFVPANIGMAINPMSARDLAIMPIPNLAIYGVCLIDDAPNDIELVHKKSSLLVEVNVSRSNHVRNGITGTFELMFYNN